MKSKRVFVAGHGGMVGSAIIRQLKKQNFYDVISRSRDELDLLNQKEVEKFFHEEKIDQVYLAAAKVGGIHANNSYPAEFIYENLMIECNIIHQAYRSGVKQLLFLGSSCIYPRLAKQPIKEEALLSGYLEPTNEPYAIAKIAGIKLCESYNRQHKVDYRSVMPTNLYGENDNFHPENSHVIPAMLCRFHEAKKGNKKKVVVWGTGKPMREFLHVDDMASAAVFLMNLERGRHDEYSGSMMSHINLGSGIDCTIAELAETIKCVVGFKGEIVYDTSKPDGAPRKLMDISRLKSLGWEPSIDLEQGLNTTYQWFLANEEQLRMI